MKIILLVLGAALFVSTGAFAKVSVAASIPDLASIASYVGGDRVATFSICRNTGDPHTVEVLPSYMVKVSRADIYLKVGLSLDQWADGIIDGARNSRIRVVDCGQGFPVLEKPNRADAYLAAQGDVHPQGNPHYWLNPDIAAVVAGTIADALIAADPAGAETYRANLARFQAEETEKMAAWKSALATLPNRSIIPYHASWIYFADAFGLDIVAYIEPLPGIPPTPSHLAELLDVIKSRQVKVVLQEPYYSDEAPNYLARETGVRVIKLPPSCADASVAAYFSHIQQLIDAINAES